MMSPSLLLNSELILLWSFSNYGIASDPVPDTKRPPVDRELPKLWIACLVLRCLIVGVLTPLLADHSAGAWALASLLAAGSLLLPVARRWWVPATYGAELEIGANALFVFIILECTAHWQLQSMHGHTFLPFSETRTSAIYLITAITIFSIRGATYIVRGILNKCGALPELAVPVKESVVPRPNRVVSETAVDAVEFNRGRWIGHLERILLLVIIADASYESIAFLMAAKSLIRAKELENREWAEYFLLGTLASVVVALGAGLAIRAILKAYW